MTNGRRIERPVLCCVLAVALSAAGASAQQAVYLVRHAEKVDSSADADLSAAGSLRAATLARVLRDAGVTAIFTSQFRRTIKTAQPLADAVGRTPVVVPGGDPMTTAARIRALGPSDVALVVGHSNTLAPLLKDLGDFSPPVIADADYDNLFVVLPRPGGSPTVLRLHY